MATCHGLRTCQRVPASASSSQPSPQQTWDGRDSGHSGAGVVGRADGYGGGRIPPRLTSGDDVGDGDAISAIASIGLQVCRCSANALTRLLFSKAWLLGCVHNVNLQMVSVLVSGLLWCATTSSEIRRTGTWDNIPTTRRLSSASCCPRWPAVASELTILAPVALGADKRATHDASQAWIAV